MEPDRDDGITTQTRRRRGDTTYDVFEDIESFCKTHHFTIFYGSIEQQGYPQASWDREEDPRWETFISLAKSFDVRTIYLHRSIFTSHDLYSVSARVRRTHTEKIEAFSKYLGLVGYVEVAFLVEGIIHSFFYQSEWYTEFTEAVGLAPLKPEYKDSAM
jgi:hypothetical protein